MKKGRLSLLAAAFAWSWPNVIIRMLKSDFDLFTQNFFRYSAATVFLFALGFLFLKKDIIHAGKNYKMLIIPALIMSLNQIFFTAGVFMTSAVVSNLMGRLSAVIIPALAYIFYEDERRVVGNRYFLLGAFIALVGVAGVILGKSVNVADGFNLGTLFVVLGTFSWSSYAIYVKKLVRSINPLAIIAFVSLFATFIFLPIVLIFGDISRIAHAPIRADILLFGSGILGVGIGNAFFYHAIKYVGASVSSVLH